LDDIFEKNLLEIKVRDEENNNLVISGTLFISSKPISHAPSYSFAKKE